MMAMMEQALGLQIDSLDRVQEKACQLLAEHRTAEQDIALVSRHARGEGLDIEPRVTPSYRKDDEDSIEVLYTLYHEALTESQEIVVKTAQKYLNAGALTYATFSRVAKVLGPTVGDTRDDNEILQGLYMMLQERVEAQDERVGLTDTEAIAIRRAPLIERARKELQRLRTNQKYVGDALSIMGVLADEEYALLWKKYVEGRSEPIVRSELYLSERSYRTIRSKALDYFVQRCPVESLITRDDAKYPYRKRGRRRNIELRLIF